MTGVTDDDKWIHRDKLAKIERAPSCRYHLAEGACEQQTPQGRSEEKLNGGSKRTTSAPPDDEIPLPRSRKSSISPENRVPEDRMPEDIPSWDLRRPEEIESDEAYWTFIADKKSGSKIPVAKASPAPIPEFYLERNAPSGRRRSGGSELETIAYPKPRPRSGSANTLGAASTLQPAKRNLTDVSPRKGSGGLSAAGRKTSAQVKAGGKTRTRGGKDSTSSISGNRPTTRSGDLSPGAKRPEGDPPWMIGSYRPDPRLPPNNNSSPPSPSVCNRSSGKGRASMAASTTRSSARSLRTACSSRPKPDRALRPRRREAATRRVAAQGRCTQEPHLFKHQAEHLVLDHAQDLRQAADQPAPEPPRSLEPMMPPPLPAETQTVAHVPDQPSAAANMSMSGEKKKKSGGCGCCVVM
ncbi:LOW QUALITY PROTEIN: hypothetical protein Ct61P_12787 [Colletotrichum tofieldiae]|nr:LOW QUALITY PROTEIN: hypothetical protein Ct61P_12787 [Colletotrichum tofieldiae]